jgi:hypothetical protein
MARSLPLDTYGEEIQVEEHLLYAEENLAIRSETSSSPWHFSFSSSSSNASSPTPVMSNTMVPIFHNQHSHNNNTHECDDDLLPTTFTPSRSTRAVEPMAPIRPRAQRAWEALLEAATHERLHISNDAVVPQVYKERGLDITHTPCATRAAQTPRAPQKIRIPSPVPQLRYGPAPQLRYGPAPQVVRCLHSFVPNFQ